MEQTTRLGLPFSHVGQFPGVNWMLFLHSITIEQESQRIFTSLLARVDIKYCVDTIRNDVYASRMLGLGLQLLCGQRSK